MFEELKRKSIFISSGKKSEKIFYILYFKDNRGCVKGVYSNGKDIELGKYGGSDRIIRELDEFFEKIQSENAFVIDWGDDTGTVYIDENERVMKLLKLSKNFVNEKMESIEFSDIRAKITIKLEENGENIKPVIVIDGKDREIKFISEGYILSDNTVYEIEDIGENYLNFSLFTKEFEKDKLENYLSLLYSNFENIDIEYKEYQLLFEDGEEAIGSIIIDNIDKSGSLYLEIGYKIQGNKSDWVREYDITTVAHINEIEEKIVLKEVVTEKAEKDIQMMMDIIEKAEKKLKIKEKMFFEGTTLILCEESAKELITNNLSFLLNSFEMMGSEKLIDYKLRIVKPKLNMNMSYNIDFFEGEATVELNGEEKSIFDMIDSYKKNGYIPLKDGTNGIVNKSYIDKLERIFKKKKDGAKLSFFDMPLVGELLEEKILKEKFPKVREIYEGFNTIESYAEVNGIVNAELRSYQQYGVKWMKYLYDNSLGGCLADDMGLGKTIQAITFFSILYPENKTPSMVVLPKSLIYNWENEIKKFNPNLTYYIYYGNNRDIDEAVKSNIIITTYGTLRSDIENIREKEFLTVMLDESQNIKNMNSQAYKSVMLLNCSKRFALSGTPVENSINELYALFSFLNPAMFGSYTEFNRYYGTPIHKNGDEDAAIQLKKKIYPFILRRTKKEVLKELPDKVENTIYVEMDKEHAAFYNERREYYKSVLDNQIKEVGIEKSQFFIFQALSELRQIASNPELKTEGKIVSQKREVLLESILDAVSNKHKVLVFTNYIGSVENIGSDLDKNGIEYLTITGATRDRQKIVDEFQKNKKCKVLIMTLKTGGVGLNLTEADTVFIYDPWWNKAAEAQAVDRTHRIGQKNTVFSYKMITKNSIEEKIAELQEKKGELFNSLISSDSASAKNIDKDDIEFILGV
jgi:superfamily II DNA or RNA helicase